MKVLFLHDTPKYFIGGAELSNLKIIEKGLNLSYNIEYDELNDFEKTKKLLKITDLVIVSSIVRCFYEIDLIKHLVKSKIPYVKYEHDYGFCALRNVYCLVVNSIKACCSNERFQNYNNLYSHAITNVFLSEQHYKIHLDVYGKSVKDYFLMPSPINISCIKSHKKRTLKCVFVGDLSIKKGAKELLEYASLNLDISIEVYGNNKQDMDLPPNVNIMGFKSNIEILNILSKAKYFYFKPLWFEPYGRVALEAYLSGCELIVNNKIGALDYEGYKNDKNILKTIIANVPSFFWEEVTKAYFARKKVEKIWNNVLVFKSYGGLGDVFISLPAILKLKKVSKKITYAIGFELASFFNEKYKGVDFVNYDDALLEDLESYDKVIDIANYPAFRTSKINKYSINYPTHNKLKQHAVKHYISGVARLHASIDTTFDKFPFLARENTKDSYFTIHTGAGFMPKCWPIEFYCQLINKLFLLYPNLYCKAIVGPDDPQNFKNIIDNNRLELIKTNLCEVGVILSGATFHIGNDSGITHFSGIFNVPVVAIHGLSGPGTWASLSLKREVVWGKKGNCDVMCNYHTAINCDHRNCLTKLKVETVMNALYKLLSSELENAVSIYLLAEFVEIKQFDNEFHIIQNQNEFVLTLTNKYQIQFLENLVQKRKTKVVKFKEVKELYDALCEYEIIYKVPIDF